MEFSIIEDSNNFIGGLVMLITKGTCITTYQDAETYVKNSGVENWEWGGAASLEGFIDYVYKLCNELDDVLFARVLVSYLKSVGENPVAYDVQG